MERMRNKIILLTLLLTAMVLSARAQNYTAAQVRQIINASTAKMRTLQCDFTQTKSLSMLKSKAVSRGHMYYSQPNKLRWEYTSPYTYTFVLNGQTVVMKNAKGRTSVSVAQSKMFKEVTRIMMSSVVGSCLSNNRDFRVSLQGQGNSWRALLTPKRNPMKQMFKTITVYFDMRKAMVSKVKMVEKNNDTTVITLQNAKTNGAINDKIFNL